MNENKNILRLEVIWKDPDMIELNIKVSNDRFSGWTNVYDNSDDLYDFALKLDKLPKITEKLIYECGNEAYNSYFKIEFYPINDTGKVGVLIYLQNGNSSENRFEEAPIEKLRMELIVEPNTIDNFQRELIHLAKTENGIAELVGV